MVFGVFEIKKWVPFTFGFYFFLIAIIGRPFLVSRKDAIILNLTKVFYQFSYIFIYKHGFWCIVAPYPNVWCNYDFDLNIILARPIVLAIKFAIFLSISVPKYFHPQPSRTNHQWLMQIADWYQELISRVIGTNDAVFADFCRKFEPVNDFLYGKLHIIIKPTNVKNLRTFNFVNYWTEICLKPLIALLI